MEESEFKDRAVEFIQSEEQKEKIMKNNSEDTLRDLWEAIKRTNIYIIGIPEGKERDKGAERLFKEIMAENFPIIGKETDIHIQKFQRFQIR